jgi:hypothetical protein
MVQTKPPLSCRTQLGVAADEAVVERAGKTDEVLVGVQGDDGVGDHARWGDQLQPIAEVSNNRRTKNRRG